MTSLCVVHVWSCAHFAQTKHVKRADLLELSFWSSLSVLWLTKLLWQGWRNNWECELFMLLKRQISSVHFVTVWTVDITLARRSQAATPTYHQWLWWREKRRGGCTERALKLHFVPLCIITITRDPWCIAVSCWDGGQNDLATRKNSMCLLGQTLKTLHDHP